MTPPSPPRRKLDLAGSQPALRPRDRLEPLADVPGHPSVPSRLRWSDRGRRRKAIRARHAVRPKWPRRGRRPLWRPPRLRDRQRKGRTACACSWAFVWRLAGRLSPRVGQMRRHGSCEPHAACCIFCYSSRTFACIKRRAVGVRPS